MRFYYNKAHNYSHMSYFRHGRNHDISPTEVNYRANLLALKRAGCTHVLAANACGALQQEVQPGHFVTIDSFIDW